MNLDKLTYGENTESILSYIIIGIGMVLTVLLKI